MEQGLQNLFITSSSFYLEVAEQIWNINLLRNREVALPSHICFPIRLMFHQHQNSHIAYPGSSAVTTGGRAPLMAACVPHLGLLKLCFGTSLNYKSAHNDGKRKNYVQP